MSVPDDFDLPDSEGAPHPILAYVAKLKAANSALRAAMEQAVQTCSQCAGTCAIVALKPNITDDNTEGATVVYTSRWEKRDCPQCQPWRDLLAQKVDHA